MSCDIFSGLSIYNRLFSFQGKDKKPSTMNTVAYLCVFAVGIALCECCCTPSQWEGTQSLIAGLEVNGKGGSEHAFVKIAYDADNQRIAAKYFVSFHFKGYERSFGGTAIYDFQKGKRFLVSDCGKTCSISYLDAQFQEFCIPENAKRYPASVLGLGDNSISVDSYVVAAKEVYAIVGVTDGCVPVSEILMGRMRGVGFTANVGYVNISAGISDESVFTPPDICGSDQKLYFNKKYPFMDKKIKEDQVKNEWNCADTVTKKDNPEDPDMDILEDHFMDLWGNLAFGI